MADFRAIDFPLQGHHTPIVKENKEYDKFKDTMRRLMGVPLAEVKELEKKERKKRRTKKPSASRAATAKS